MSKKANKDLEPIVQFEGVSFSYGEVPVLEDVNLSILPKQNLYIVGPNGGGKTTLLKLILGLIKPDKGTIRVFGKEPELGRRRIGYMPQYTEHDRAFPVTVLDVVLMARLGRSLAGSYTRDDKKSAHSALEEMGMLDHAHHSFAKLSGGQKQRVLIARALANDPGLLLLDEATASVDAHAGSRLFDLLDSLNGRLSICLVSHDLGFVHKLFDRVVFVNRTVRSADICEIDGDLVQEIYGEDSSIIHHHGHGRGHRH